MQQQQYQQQQENTKLYIRETTEMNHTHWSYC